SSSEKYVDSPSEAAPVKGDWVVAVLLRSGEIDFVSLSALTGYGALSDQGRNFSVNLHGAALWSFPASDSDELTGRSNGLLDGQVGEAIAALSGNGFLVVRVNSGTAARGNKMKQETYFLEKLED